MSDEVRKRREKFLADLVASQPASKKSKPESSERSNQEEDQVVPHVEFLPPQVEPGSIAPVEHPASVADQASAIPTGEPQPSEEDAKCQDSSVNVNVQQASDVDGPASVTEGATPVERATQNCDLPKQLTFNVSFNISMSGGDTSAAHAIQQILGSFLSIGKPALMPSVHPKVIEIPNETSLAPRSKPEAAERLEVLNELSDSSAKPEAAALEGAESLEISNETSGTSSAKPEAAAHEGAESLEIWNETSGTPSAKPEAVECLEFLNETSETQRPKPGADRCRGLKPASDAMEASSEFVDLTTDDFPDVLDEDEMFRTLRDDSDMDSDEEYRPPPSFNRKKSLSLKGAGSAQKDLKNYLDSLVPGQRSTRSGARPSGMNHQAAINDQAGPSGINHQAGINDQAGPSGINHQAGVNYQAGPSRVNPQAGPSRINHGAGPSRINHGAGPSEVNAPRSGQPLESLRARYFSNASSSGLAAPPRHNTGVQPVQEVHPVQGGQPSQVVQPDHVARGVPSVKLPMLPAALGPIVPVPQAEPAPPEAQPAPAQAQPAPPPPPPQRQAPNGICLVCMDRFVEARLRCDHCFCVPCLVEMKERKQACPLCQKVFRKWKPLFGF